MIKGLAITPPALGRISMGLIVEKNGKRLPEKDDQFTFTSQIQNKDGWVKHPLDEQLAVVMIDFTRLPGILAMLCVSFLTTLGCILGNTATCPLTLWRSAPKLVENSRVGATYLSSDGAKGKPLTMQSLNHTPFFQRKMAAGCTYVLDYVRMVVIHSDCSFVDDFSQNHFNMKRHYGFLFFD